MGDSGSSPGAESGEPLRRQRDAGFAPSARAEKTLFGSIAGPEAGGNNEDDRRRVERQRTKRRRNEGRCADPFRSALLQHL